MSSNGPRFMARGDRGSTASISTRADRKDPHCADRHQALASLEPKAQYEGFAARGVESHAKARHQVIPALIAPWAVVVQAFDEALGQMHERSCRLLRAVLKTSSRP